MLGEGSGVGDTVLCRFLTEDRAPPLFFSARPFAMLHEQALLDALLRGVDGETTDREKGCV